MSVPFLNVLTSQLSPAVPTPVAIIPYRAITGVATAGTTPTFNPATGAISTISSTSETVLIADAVVEEEHEDELVITEHPVQVGATISDHAYKLPSRLGLEYGWAMGSPQNATRDPSFLNNIYKQLLGLMNSRILCEVNTGKRIYKNMLIQRIIENTNKETENVLLLRVSLQEIIMANTQSVPLTPAAVQALPQKTAPTQNQGFASLLPGSTFNANAVPQQ